MIRPLSLTGSFLLIALLAACNGDKEPGPVPAQPNAPRSPLVEKAQVADWCKEHGVPESVCTRCNPKLVDEFKKKGDWCTKHDLPDSQCLTCHPEFAAKFAAMAPKSAK